MLGLICLLIIVLAMGLYSISQCSELGKRIQKISAAHDSVGQDITQMKQGCAAMTGALLTLATGDGDKSREEFQKASTRFNDALNRESERTRIPQAEEDLIISWSTHSRHTTPTPARSSLRPKARPVGVPTLASSASKPPHCSTWPTNLPWRTSKTSPRATNPRPTTSSIPSDSCGS